MTRNSSVPATQKSGPRAREGAQKPRSPQGGREGAEGKPLRRCFSEPETRGGRCSAQTPGLRPGRAEEPPAARSPRLRRGAGFQDVRGSRSANPRRLVSLASPGTGAGPAGQVTSDVVAWAAERPSR